MKNNFIEKLLISALEFFKDALFCERYTTANGLLQKINPAVKLIGLLVILLAISLSKSIQVILVLYGLSMILAALSKIDLLYFTKRVWVFIPIFSLFIAIPSIFSLFSPGEAVYSFKLFSIMFVITRQGLLAAALFVSRVLASIAYAILMVLTTGQTRLLRALGAVRVPDIFVSTFMMSFRYIYILLATIEDLYMGLKSRAISKIKNRKAYNISALHISVIWSKSTALSQEVYEAMLSRGYSGRHKNG